MNADAQAIERLRAASVSHMHALQVEERTVTDPQPWLLPTYAALRDAVWEVWPRNSPDTERHLLCGDGVVFHYGIGASAYGLTLGYDVGVVAYAPAASGLERARRDGALTRT